ncbi:hypothetical protein B0T16DRAFT_456074 [Cercophora newfieldiana]|uniref:Uncharacterized protein n=1 Tax=Cercophora newfieldiana TaxID=92897 RepID=A0AA40CS23_9PEZI|nr:hypothetical protein B0T16DRAFT_456074 [Cercophora newfieldiana]
MPGKAIATPVSEMALGPLFESDSGEEVEYNPGVSRHRPLKSPPRDFYVGTKYSARRVRRDLRREGLETGKTRKSASKRPASRIPVAAATKRNSRASASSKSIAAPGNTKEATVTPSLPDISSVPREETTAASSSDESTANSNDSFFSAENGSISSDLDTINTDVLSSPEKLTLSSASDNEPDCPLSTLMRSLTLQSNESHYSLPGLTATPPSPNQHFDLSFRRIRAQFVRDQARLAPSTFPCTTRFGFGTRRYPHPFWEDGVERMSYPLVNGEGCWEEGTPPGPARVVYDGDDADRGNLKVYFHDPSRAIPAGKRERPFTEAVHRGAGGKGGFGLREWVRKVGKGVRGWF